MVEQEHYLMFLTGAPINSSANAAHVNNHYYYDISRSGSVNATLKLKFSGLDCHLLMLTSM